MDLCRHDIEALEDSARKTELCVAALLRAGLLVQEEREGKLFLKLAEGNK